MASGRKGNVSVQFIFDLVNFCGRQNFSRFNRSSVARLFIFEPKTQFGLILEGLRMENVGIFFTIWNILLTFGVFYGRLV
jgi:hypothetical protein